VMIGWSWGGLHPTDQCGTLLVAPLSIEKQKFYGNNDILYHLA
jgi:hypothetical protein